MILEYINSISNLFLENPFAQISGLLGMLFVWIAFLYDDDIKTIRSLLIASIFWGIQFALLESYAGLAAIIIGSLRLYLSIKYKKNKKVFLFLVALILFLGVIVYDGYISLLPIIGSLLGAYGFFFFSGILLRAWCLAISITWLFYNYYVGSIGGIINEIVVEILIIVAMYRYIGVNGYKLQFISKIKSIIHPNTDIDYGFFHIVKDKNKIYKKYGPIEEMINYGVISFFGFKKYIHETIIKIKNLINSIKLKIKNLFVNEEKELKKDSL